VNKAEDFILNVISKVEDSKKSEFTGDNYVEMILSNPTN
jgi:hypothetical protein